MIMLNIIFTPSTTGAGRDCRSVGTPAGRRTSVASEEEEDASSCFGLQSILAKFVEQNYISIIGIEFWLVQKLVFNARAT